MPYAKAIIFWTFFKAVHESFMKIFGLLFVENQ